MQPNDIVCTNRKDAHPHKNIPQPKSTPDGGASNQAAEVTASPGNLECLNLPLGPQCNPRSIHA